MENTYIIEDTINDFVQFTHGKKYCTIYADPPWQFANRTGKMAPENKRLSRYSTMKLNDIMKLPVSSVAAEKSHLYLWSSFRGRKMLYSRSLRRRPYLCC